MKCSLGLLASLSTLFTVLASSSWAGPWVLSPNEFHSDIRGSYFSTETYRDAAGERPPLVGGGVYESRAIRWSTELGWRKGMSFAFDIPFESITRQFDPNPEFSRTGLSDLMVGFNWGILSGSTALALEADWKAPLGYNRRVSTPLGNGRQEAIGILHFGRELPGLGAFVQLQGGYRALLERSDDPALPKDQTLLGADLGWWVGPSLLLSGTYRGRMESNDAAFPVTAHRVGPQVLYRVDEHLDVFAGSLHTAKGENVMHIDEFYAGIATKKTALGALQGFLGGMKRP